MAAVPLTSGEIEQLEQQLPGWSLVDGKLHRELVFSDFNAAFGFMTRVALIAKLEVWIELPAHLDAKARKILQKAGENCPVKVSLEGAVPMELHWS